MFQLKSRAKNLISYYFALSPILLRLTLLFLTAYFINYYNHTLFHISFELISALFALSVFLLAWNARSIIQNNFLMNLSIGFLFVGILDFVYALSPQELNIFRGYDVNVEEQLWLAGRYVLGLTFLGSLLYINRRLNYFRILVFSGLLVGLLFISIFLVQALPQAYTLDGSLSSFYTTSEFVITVITLVALILLRRHREYFDNRILTLLSIALIISAATDLMYFLGANSDEIWQILGHSFKVLSYYYIYKAIVEVGLSEPYKLLFSEIEKRSERKDELLSVASHEIKSPVSSIVLYSQLLEGKLQNGHGDAELAQKIHRQANKVSQLVNDLLDLTKMESNDILYNFHHFNLKDLIADVVDKQKHIARSYKIVYENPLNEGVYGDKEKLEQVLDNLIDNAVKYSNSGSVITLKTNRTDNFITISVEDKGIGIPPESYSDIFKKFYRTPISLQKAEGLGIGLYISKNIIEKHNGKMWFKSEEGKGSIFYFTIPLVEDNSSLGEATAKEAAE